MKPANRWCRYAVAIAAIMLGHTATAHAQSSGPYLYRDAEFRAESWEVDIRYSGAGQELRAMREMVDGNPGAFLGMQFDLPIGGPRAATPEIIATHHYYGGIFDSAFMGAIGGLTVSVDRRELADDLDGVEVHHAFVLFQDGEIFTADLGDCCTADWAIQETTTHCLHPQDFENDNQKQPDFSDSGGRIDFGLQTSVANLSAAGPRSVAVGYDNFRVVVAREDDPTCAVVLPDVRVGMSGDNHVWGDDPVVPFEITIVNEGAATGGLELTSVVPDHTTFAPAASTGGWACTGDGSQGSTCTFPLPVVDGDGAEQSVVFATRVNDGTDPAVDIYVEAELGEAGGAQGVGYIIGALFFACVMGALSCFFDIFACCYFLLVAGPLCFVLTLWGPRAAVEVPDRPLFDSFVAYRMRDDVFAHTRGGRRAVELFYELNDDFIQATLDKPELLDLARAALHAWEPYMRSLADDDGFYPSDLYPVFPQELAALQDYLDAMRTVASPALAAAMDRERPNLDVTNWTGLTSDQILARLHRLSCPGHEGVLPCGALNDDCKITATDALLALKMAVKTLPVDPAADNNGNGSVTATDALGILRVGVKLDPPSFACAV